MNQLNQIIEGCLSPQTIHASEKALQEYSQSPTFLSELLQLVPGQEQNKLIMILSTVKNYVLARYNHPQNPIPQTEKSVLRDNFFNFFYEINHCPQAINLYCQILYAVLAVDFESYKPLFYDLLQKDLNSSIVASTYFCRQLAKVYEWLNDKNRLPLEEFIKDFFPQLQSLVEKVLTNYNETTSKLLEQLLKMFYSCFHLQIPFYLRDYGNIGKWILFNKTILAAPLDHNPTNHRLVTRIYVKFISMYCSDLTDGPNYKGWAQSFRERFAQNIYTEVVGYLVNPLNDEQITSNIVTCIYNIVKNQKTRPLIQQAHCDAIIYQYLLPYMQSTADEIAIFTHESLEYIRRDEDITCYNFRRTALDLIKSLMVSMHYGQKSELIKFVEHAAQIFTGNSTDKQKEVILIVLTYLSQQLLKNKFLYSNFEQLTQQYFIPLLSNENEVLVSQTCKLLSEYLRIIKLSTPVVKSLLSLLYDKLCNNNLAVRYHASLAFTQLLDDQQALEQAKPHFQNILQIYVKLLDVLDHEKLLGSLEQIVKIFSNEIVTVAKDLSSHLFNVFYTLHQKQQQNEDSKEDDGPAEATAAISTIKQILEAPLEEETYFSISENILILLKNICDEYDDYFEEILTIFNVLVFRTRAITDWEFPYVFCRKLLEGNNNILQQCNLSKDLVEIISKAEKPDPEYNESLLSILKNLIQKMPEQILHHYPYPTDQQLLLCLIENKKLTPDQIGMLPTNQIDQQWTKILQSYTSYVYGIGEICNCSETKAFSGISLFPWIDRKLDLTVIKRVLALFIEEDQEDQEDFDEQNTIQMLQKFANEDQDEDVDDYYISEGGSYSTLYQSPFDVTKDCECLVARLKQFSSHDIGNLMSQLKPKYRSKLQTLLSP